MKIEPGKFYRTRDGRKARIYAVESEGTYPIHGAILTYEGWRADEWTGKGRSSAYHDVPLSFDLVGEWRDEPRVFWVNVYPKHTVFHTSRKEANELALDTRVECIRVVESPESPEEDT